MATEKVTVRSQFEDVKAVLLSAGRTDLAEFIDGRIAQTIKKNSAERKPTAKQVANEGYKDAIVEWMEPDHLYLAAEIAKSCPAIVENGVSAGTVTALLTQLYNAGKIVRTEDKRKNYYSLAE